jgi:hypothetical protein
MIRRRGGVVRGVARTAVVAGTASAVAGGVHHRQARRWAAKDQEQYAEQQAAYDQAYAEGAAAAQAAAPPPPPQPAPAPAASAGAGDTIAELQQLADLKAQGILTEAEFAAQKAKILGS